MPKSIHITTAKKMLESGKPVDLQVYTKDGRFQTHQECIGLRYDLYTGTRRIKLLRSGQIRVIRDCLIMSINGMQVYL